MDISSYYFRWYHHYRKLEEENPGRFRHRAQITSDLDFCARWFRGLDLAVVPHTLPIMNGFHSHDFFEFIYVYHGSCQNVVDSQTLHLNEGDLCLLNTWAVHSLNLCHPGEDVVFNLLVKRPLVENTQLRLLSGAGFLSDFFLESLCSRRNADNYVLFRRTGAQAPYEEFVQRIIRDHNENFLYREQMYDFLFQALIVELVRSHQQSIEEEHPPGLGSRNITEILQYIEKHFDTVSITSLAEHFNYHPKYIPRLLKKYTNHSFSDILLGVRLKKAQMLLTQTQLPIAEVMAQAGFTNRTWFTQKFRDHFSVRPDEYRRQHERRSF
ncbi:MAG: helix-turn-helix domain-containing protein [Clostridiales bacterium]|nr:helix-turn-helix domain-containing protein [Clostridiales bacterium]